MDELHERMAVMETKQTAQEAHNARQEKKIDEMYEVIIKLKGAKYFGWFLAAAVGYVVHTIIPLLGIKQ